MIEILTHCSYDPKIEIIIIHEGLLIDNFYCCVNLDYCLIFDDHLLGGEEKTSLSVDLDYKILC